MSLLSGDISSSAKDKDYKAMAILVISPLRVEINSHILRFLARKWSQRKQLEEL